jgi:hypothetical protein
MQLLSNIDLSSYSLLNWLRWQPLIHLLKSSRYKRIDRAYRARPPRVLELDARARAPGNKLLITIAFEDVELIKWQARLLRLYVPSAVYIVVDNSRSDSSAQGIQNACRLLGCSYVRPPENPWPGSPSRSHGAALNWAWENVIKPTRPKMFGFVDPDLLPLEQTDPFEPLCGQDFYGVFRYVGSRWFLWTGFCLFRFSAVEALPLDFGQAWFLGLDTGGANWNVLYKAYDLTRLRQMETRFYPFKEGIAWTEGPLQRCGPWIHEIGQMGDPRFAAEKREHLRALVGARLSGDVS